MALATPRWSRKDLVSLPLACDSSMRAANSEEALKAFLESSDPLELFIPADATRVFLQPLGLREDQAAERRAGIRPHRGFAVWATLYGDGEEGLYERLAVLPETDLLAMMEHELWLKRLSFERVRVGLRQIFQPGDDELSGTEAIPEGGILSYPAPMLEELVRVNADFLFEVHSHLSRISKLSTAGKVSSGSQSGPGTSGRSEDGSVATVKISPDSSTPEEDAAGHSQKSFPDGSAAMTPESRTEESKSEEISSSRAPH